MARKTKVEIGEYISKSFGVSAEITNGPCVICGATEDLYLEFDWRVLCSHCIKGLFTFVNTTEKTPEKSKN